MAEFIEVEDDGHVRTVTIARPDRLNALHGPASREMGDAFDEFAAREDLWVAVVTGAGDRAFCAGNDLKAQAAGEDTSIPRSGFGGLTSRFDLDKPVIAAVNGVAMGGGFEIALACDLIVAAEHAVFALPEPRVGLAALAGGMHRLPRSIPLKHAMGMMLTGRRVSADEGRQLGFVNEVVPAGELEAAVGHWVGAILECSPMSLRASKQAAYRGLDMSLPDAIAGQTKLTAVRAMLESEDWIEGPRAFTEKRPPEWKGR
jgi:enoyl-CoA hydratase/carnithine racemase